MEYCKNLEVVDMMFGTSPWILVEYLEYVSPFLAEESLSTFFLPVIRKSRLKSLAYSWSGIYSRVVLATRNP